MTTTDTRGARLATPQKVMIGGFVAVAFLVWVVVQLFLYGGVDPVAIVIGALALTAAGLVATGRRWGLITATVLAALLFLFDLPKLIGQLGGAGSTGWFVVSLLGLACYLTILGAAAVALSRTRRRA